MSESADIKGRWVFARFWVFPRPNIMKRFLWTFWLYCRINGPFGRKEAWCMNSSWVTSVIVIRISASSVIFKLRELNFERPASSISYIFPLTVILRLYSLRAQYIRYESCISHMWMFTEPIFYLTVREFVCTPGATTNFYGRKYRIQGQFSKSQGKCSNHFASHILGLSV